MLGVFRWRISEQEVDGMRGCHAIPTRLDDGDLYVGLRGGHCWGFLGEE